MIDFIKLLVSLSISGGILCIILIIFDPVLKKVMDKGFQYYIWLIPLFRFIVPFSPKLNLMTYWFNPNNNIVPLYVNHNEINFSVDEFSNIPYVVSRTTQADYNIYFWVGLIWLVVSLLILVHKIVSYRSFARFIKIGSKIVNDNDLNKILEKVKSEIGIRKSINIYVNPLATSPMILGLFNPVIILPHVGNENQVYYTMLHELTHLKRGDIFYKWFIQLVQCIHWFNPIVYVTDSIIRKKCELSCDYTVVKHLDSSQCREYGDTILQSVKTNGDYGSWFGTATLSEDAKSIKERLEAIMNKQHSTKKLLFSSITLMFGVIIGAFLMGSYNNLNNHSDILESAITPISDERYVSSQSKDIQNSQTSSEIISVNEVNQPVESILPNENSSSQVRSSEISTDQQTQSSTASSSTDIQESSKVASDPPQTISETPQTYDIQRTGSSNVDSAAIQVMQYSGSWSITEMLLPYMSSQGIETVVSMYNEKNPNNMLNVSNYYNLAIPSQSETDSTCYNLMQNTGNWTFCSPLFPYMSNNGILNAVTLYNQKTGKNVLATDYYN